MADVKINLGSIEKVRDFCRVAGSTDLNLDLVSGRYVIDAKSIMGIFSLDLSKPVTLQIHGETKEICDNFIDKISDFIVK